MKKEDRPLLIVKVRKRHLAAIIVLIAIAVLYLSVYLRFFMVLPQSAINILQQAPIDLKEKRVLVYSPHCDDETLGAYGVIDKTIAEGGSVHLVMVTDCNKHKTGQTRKAETVAAMKVAGMAASDIEYLDFPEGREKKDSQEAQRFRQMVKDEIAAFKPDYILSPHSQDTHVDHKFVGKNVDEVAKELKIDNEIIYYLIHYNFLKYPSPPGFKPEAYLLPPARLITFTDRWYRFDLSNDEENRKEDAVLLYKSQLRKSNPVLMRVLFDFVRQNELFMIKNHV